jgi:hypothetical protein
MEQFEEIVQECADATEICAEAHERLAEAKLEFAQAEQNWHEANAVLLRCTGNTNHGLLAQRIAYANEFDGDESSIHENILKLKIANTYYRSLLARMVGSDSYCDELWGEVRAALAAVTYPDCPKS